MTDAGIGDNLDGIWDDPQLQSTTSRCPEDGDAQTPTLSGGSSVEAAHAALALPPGNVAHRTT